MFIEQVSWKDFSSLQRSETDSPTIAGTLRSAGARVVAPTGSYKHLAPLEPEPYLVAAKNRAVSSYAENTEQLLAATERSTWWVDEYGTGSGSDRVAAGTCGPAMHRTWSLPLPDLYSSAAAARVLAARPMAP
jgi:hypothetical protein